jgi:hypothetical protein
MSLDQLAVTLYLTVHGRTSPDTTAVATLAAMFALQVAVVLILWRVFRRGDTDGDDPGPGGGGPGWRRRPGPRKPPPNDPVCWPEFERQFAEHVASLGARDRASSPGTDRVSGRYSRDIMATASRSRST